jgi:hypothetical protein
VDGVDYDEAQRWLVVRRGPYELACNFGSGSVRIPSRSAAVELTAAGDSQPARLADGFLTLPAMSGALIR